MKYLFFVNDSVCAEASSSRRLRFPWHRRWLSDLSPHGRQARSSDSLELCRLNVDLGRAWLWPDVTPNKFKRGGVPAHPRLQPEPSGDPNKSSRIERGAQRKFKFAQAVGLANIMIAVGCASSPHKCETVLLAVVRQPKTVDGPWISSRDERPISSSVKKRRTGKRNGSIDPGICNLTTRMPRIGPGLVQKVSKWS